MEIGFHVPQLGADTNRRGFTDFAQAMEAAGVDSLWVSDHVVFPRENAARMDYAEGGTYPKAWIDLPLLEPITAMTYLAAVTERVRIGVSVMVVPMRNPVVLAKELASLDVLSGGRLILGAGVGWLREEYQALNTPWEKRGARFEDCLDVIEALWTRDHTALSRETFELPDVGFYPKPAQRPRPPIWIGGNSDVALRRAARRGDGWHTISLSPEDVVEVMPKFREALADAGRTPGEVPFSLRDKIDFEGPPEPIVDRLQRHRDAGVRHFVVSSGFGSAISVSARLVRTAEAVVAGLKAG